MKSQRRVLTVIASILLILITLGCHAPAGSAGSAGSASSNAAPTPVAAFEQAFAEVPAGEPALDSSSAGGTVSGTAADSDFSGVGDVDDPFAAIGPAFSGLGFQTYSSGCDPFEDAYGTCL